MKGTTFTLRSVLTDATAAFFEATFAEPVIDSSQQPKLEAFLIIRTAHA